MKVCSGKETSYNESLAVSDASKKLKMAVAFEASGKHESALTSTEEALTLQKDYIDAWVFKGILLDKFGKCDEAMKCFDKIIEIKPTYIDAYRLKGATLVSLNKLRKGC